MAKSSSADYRLLFHLRNVFFVYLPEIVNWAVCSVTAATSVESAISASDEYDPHAWEEYHTTGH